MTKKESPNSAHGIMVIGTYGAEGLRWPVQHPPPSAMPLYVSTFLWAKKIPSRVNGWGFLE